MSYQSQLRFVVYSVHDSRERFLRNVHASPQGKTEKDRELLVKAMLVSKEGYPVDIKVREILDYV